MAHSRDADHRPQKKASIGQVAATMFFGLIAIGRKNTWQKNGAAVTFAQVVVGALIGLGVLIAVLVTLVLVATR